MFKIIETKIFWPLVEWLNDLVPPRYKKRLARAGALFGRSLYLTNLKDQGYAPATAIDIGAYHGEWTKLFKSVFPETKVLMLEAQSSKSPILESVCKEIPNGVDYEIALLGEKDGEKVTFTEMETGSSVLEESSSFTRNYTEKELVTLDSIVSHYPDFKTLDFLKLDVQGYELNVLKGASNLLKRTELVYMETSLIPVNKGCPLIADVIQFMTENNFRLLDFCSQIRRKDGVLWQTDLLFVNSSSQFLPKASLDNY